MAEYIRDDIMSADKRDIKLSVESTQPCPDCSGKTGKKYNLFVRSDFDGTATLECVNCSHTMSVSSSNVPYQKGQGSWMLSQGPTGH